MKQPKTTVGENNYKSDFSMLFEEMLCAIVIPYYRINICRICSSSQVQILLLISQSHSMQRSKIPEGTPKRISPDIHSASHDEYKSIF